MGARKPPWGAAFKRKAEDQREGLEGGHTGGVGAQPAPGPEGGAAGPASGTVRPERHASTVGSVTVAWGERGEVAGSRDGASRARVGLGPSPKLEERTGGGPAGVTGPCSCFEEELGRARPEPRSQAGRPRQETAVVWTKMPTGSWGEKDAGSQESGRARTHRTQWILFQG